MDRSLYKRAGREPIVVAEDLLWRSLRDRPVVVTGAAGSIGSALSRRLLASPLQSRLTLLDQSEQALHDLGLELAAEDRSSRIRWLLGDVGDCVTLRAALEPGAVVFHAAAYKHAPLLEGQPVAATKNNFLNTTELCRIAAELNCSRLVFVSTDKAVQPRNILGASKRLAELVVQHASRPSMPATVVRLGNVWGSRGSVVPHFRSRIADGLAPIVTDPQATRFFMSEEEAVTVTLSAVEYGLGGDVLVPDLGSAVSILDVANHLLSEVGRPPLDGESAKGSGLRPGDKRSERLMCPAESRERTPHPALYRARAALPDPQLVRDAVDELEQACRQWDATRILDTLRRVLPDFVPGELLSSTSRMERSR